MKILYFGINSPEKSARDSVYLDALRKKGIVLLTCVDSSRFFAKYIGLIRKHWAVRNEYDVLFVGHMSALVVPLARLISRKPIIFNALNPLYDGLVLEREIHKPYSLGALGVWLVDFFSLHSAHRVLLETNVQIASVHKTFFMPMRKLVRVFTTVDPELYSTDPSIAKSKKFLCVFRGYITHVTGAEYIVEAAELLSGEDIAFRFIVRGELVVKIQKMISEKNLSNIEVLSEFYSFEKLRELISPGQVYLGQFSDHERLTRTIQFKTVEALSFGMAYITSDQPSNRELLHDGEDCLLVRRADPQALADAILRLKGDPALTQRLGIAAHALYQKQLAPEVLAEQILRIATALKK